MYPLKDDDSFAAIKDAIEARTGRPLPPPPPRTSKFIDDEPWVPEAQARLREQARERLLAWAREQSVIGDRFASRTFATFELAEGNREAFAAAQALVAGQRTGIGLTGPVGVGKTHLGGAIANASIELGRVAVCVPVHQLLAKIRASYGGEGPAESKIVARYAGVDVLVLDDLGKEPATRWSVDTLFALVDTRYERGRGLVVTTNHTPDELRMKYTRVRDVDGFTAQGLIDRILEMTAFPWIAVRGKSHRSGIGWGASA